MARYSCGNIAHTRAQTKKKTRAFRGFCCNTYRNKPAVVPLRSCSISDSEEPVFFENDPGAKFLETSHAAAAPAPFLSAPLPPFRSSFSMCGLFMTVSAAEKPRRHKRQICSQRAAECLQRRVGLIQSRAAGDFKLFRRRTYTRHRKEDGGQLQEALGVGRKTKESLHKAERRQKGSLMRTTAGKRGEDASASQQNENTR